METSTLPNSEVLTRHLSKLFSENGDAKNVEVISRSAFKGSSTFPAEIIKCQLPDGKILTLFGKYLAGLGPNNHGHRGGVEYEIKVYDEVLRNLPLPKANFWGKCFFKENDETLLLMDFLEGSISLKGNPDINLYLNAASWAAKMHNFFEGNVPSFVKVYDQAYYFIWLTRMENEPSILAAQPWLQDVINYFRSHIDLLIKAPQTLIHGEFYSKNILIRNGIAYPVDWESAAYAPGEIDLASIIEARKQEVVERITESYTTARFENKEFDKPSFEKRLWMAQLYLHFRFFFPKREEWRYDHIHALAKKLEIF
ncbi:MAG TPA: phosphotransferase [Chitinophagaceae bacterium]|nr:phosphotransferase [Chitinophagaceae bacterium]